MPRRRKKASGEDVARAALAYVGTPYQLRGRVPGVGLDCLGVVVCAYTAAGLPLTLRAEYRAVARMGYDDLREIRRSFVRIRRDPEDGAIPVLPGDVIFWHIGPQGHLGVVADDAAGDLAVVAADDSHGFEVVTIGPIGRADRVYRHRALLGT